MSVLVKDREISTLEFYAKIYKIRKMIVEIASIVFGVKCSYTKYKLKTENMSPEDQKIFERILKKYKIGSLNVGWCPEIFLQNFYNTLWNYGKELHESVTGAYSIYPTNKREALKRRDFQNTAIIKCECILQELQVILDFLPIDAERLMPLTGELIEEERLLKEWRKNDKRTIRFLSEDSIAS